MPSTDSLLIMSSIEGLTPCKKPDKICEKMEDTSKRWKKLLGKMRDISPKQNALQFLRSQISV